ncbi:uncharacterized protein LOC134541002 [Bacillus rossius redtenbacheri]|uniref:uncharacterized protein LOC134541002 n=1 Tax=Bacillus rossius redtenbacheri TaxID=93214 RepID=UPI002FDCE7B4
MENTVDEISHALSEASLEDGKRETGQDAGGEEARLWEALKALHCPFTWDDVLEIQREDKGTDKCKARLSQIEEKLEEIAEPDSFQYRKLVLNVVLVYERFADGDPGGALAVQRETEALLSSWSPRAGDALGRLVEGSGDALRHVVLACRAHLQFRSRVLREAGRTLAGIVPFERLDDPCRAAVSGLRAAVLMEFGYRGNVAALKHAEAAVAMDPDQGEWHFVLGKCLGRLRRIDHSFQIPDKLELKSLEEAVRLTKHPPYIVFLAQAYRETAFKVFSETRHSVTKSTVKSAIDKMNEKSLTLYKEALQLRGECSHINVRCALGLMKLPHPFKDVARAKRCLDVALELAPNNAMVNHVTAQYYQNNERDLAAAKKYYERASELGAFGSYMDLLRLRYQERRSEYDPLPDLEAGLDRYKEGPYRQELVMQTGSYHLFVRDDVEAAYGHWEKVIDEDPDSEKLRAHKCVFLPMLKPVNVYEVLCDESRLVLQLQPHRAKGKEPLYRQIILKCRKHHPSCATDSPVARRKMVLAEVEEVERARCRPKTRGRGRGRGGERGRGYRGRGRGSSGDNYNNRYQSGERRDTSGDFYNNRHQSGERRGSTGYDYSNRHQSSERRGSSRDNYSNRHQSGEIQGSSRDNYSNRHHSSERRGSSRDDYSNRHQSIERRGSSGDNYNNRHQSSERRGSSRDDYSNRHQSIERRGSSGDNYNNRHQSGERRGPSGDDYSNRHQSGERRGFGRKRGGNRPYGTASHRGRDTSTDGYNRHHSHERRGFGGSRGGGESRRTGPHPGRDSSREDGHGGASCERRGSYPGRYGEDGLPSVQSRRRWYEHGRDSSADSRGSANSCPDEARADWKKGCQASSLPVVDKDFVDARNSHFKEQHKQLKKSQEGYKMWWDE